MLPKSQRLNLKKDFRWVVSGKRTETPNFRLFLRSGSNGVALVGISLTKKSFKTAVERNRARRLVSKAVEQIYESLPKGLNLIIMPKAQILSANSEDLQKELDNVLSTNSTY